MIGDLKPNVIPAIYVVDMKKLQLDKSINFFEVFVSLQRYKNTKIQKGLQWRPLGNYFIGQKFHSSSGTKLEQTFWSTRQLYLGMELLYLDYCIIKKTDLEPELIQAKRKDNSLEIALGKKATALSLLDFSVSSE